MPTYTNDMVAHLWANQSVPGARTPSRNFWFRGAMLYSYSTPIARRMPEARCILRTSRTFSATTSTKHEPAVSRALPGGVRVFRVFSLGAPGVELRHDVNVRDYLDRIRNAIGRSKRSRTNRDFYTNEAADLITQHNEYIAAFGLDASRIDPSADLSRALEDVRALQGAQNDRWQAELARRAAEEAERTARVHLTFAEDREAWRLGRPVPRALAAFHGEPVALRIKPGDAETLETSLGAEVPLAHAIRIFRLASQCRATSTEWSRDANALTRVGLFVLDAIDHNGTIRAGCHVIPWSETERLAVSLGLLAAPVEVASVAA